ncbi:MAG: hypothetical protein KBS74_01800 [Clostridiales bacterium]|nr:hypothetical protein [Candidatus Cacconaster stercorequi]
MSKKICIAIAGAIAALAAILLIVRVAAPKEMQDSGDKNSRYSYSYEKKDSGMIMHIAGEVPKGYQWIAQTDFDCVSVEEKKQDGKKADFVLHSVNSGAGKVIFSLQKDDDVLLDRIYEIEVELQVDLNLEMTINTNYHRELSGLLHSRTDTFHCAAASLSDGTLGIYLQDDSGSAWNVKTENDTVEVLPGSMDEENHVRRYVAISRTIGSDTIKVCNADTGEGVELYVTTDLLGKADLIDQKIVYDNGGSVYADDYTVLIGHTALPKEAKASGSGMTQWISQKDHVTTYTVGYVVFTYADRNWTLYASDLVGTDDFASDSKKNATKKDTVQVSSAKANIYCADGGSVAVWTDDNGFCYLLRGASATQDDIKPVVKSLMKVIRHG